MDTQGKNIRVEELVESRLLRKLDENGFIERSPATYGKYKRLITAR